MNHAHIHPPQRDLYIDLLKRHDWAFEYSDDHSIWNAGDRSLRELRLLRPDLDPEGALWNRFAPADFQFTPVAPKATS